jgi:hypothetical protein
MGDDAANPSVIEPYGLTGLHGVEKFRQRDSAPRRTYQFLMLVEPGWPAGFERTGQNQLVAKPQGENLLTGRHASNPHAEAGFVFGYCGQNQPGGNVTGATALCPAAVTPLLQ